MRTLRWFFVLLLVLLIATVAALLWYRQSSLPTHEGTLRVAGLGAKVDIARDANGIPTLTARSEGDALFALGFSHAQDRLWQMSFNRRLAQGRLAEILGPDAVATDRFLRVLGVYRHAQRLAATLDPDTRAVLEAYASGVNAAIAARGLLPPEFLLTRAPAPEPWVPADSVAWLLMMAWDLSSHGYRNELARLRLASRMSVAEINDLRPPYPGDAPLPTQDYAAMYRVLGLFRAGAERPGQRGSIDNLVRELVAMQPASAFGVGPGLGSNSWVVSGDHTVSGAPLLANDPHLGLSTPSVWYFARINAPQLNVVGATLPGVPFVIIGRTPTVAWGLTNTNTDVQDLYLERIHPSDPQLYQTSAGFTAFETREEVIQVRNAPDVRLVVRNTRHGPVLSDALPTWNTMAQDSMFVLALRWSALEESDTTLRGLRIMNHARSVAEFAAAVRDVEVVQLSIVFADARSIGMVAPGRVPVRDVANDLWGLVPSPGWDARYDWKGWLQYPDLPQDLAPTRGFIVTANHKITGANYSHFITSEWYPPYRARRIEELLQSRPKHDAAGMRRIQADVESIAAREMVAALRAQQLPRDRLSAAAAIAHDRILAWNGAMRADAPEPLLFHAWLRELRNRIFADELGPLAKDFVDGDEMTQALLNVLQGTARSRDWCDDVSSQNRRETCADMALEALEAIVARLGKESGRDLLALRWGDAHRAVLAHRPLSNVGFLRRWFELSGPVPGDSNTVNVGQIAVRDASFATRHAATLRFVADLADARNDSWILGSGQSGHPLSEHYGDQFDAWSRAESLPITTTEHAPRPIATLVLEPARP